ncbi:hypothetical protein D3C83_218030 [compost metagenome]
MCFHISVKQRFITKHLELLDVTFHDGGLFGQGTAALQHPHRPRDGVLALFFDTVHANHRIDHRDDER